MSATKSDLRRAILRTAALTHWRHNLTRRALPCAVNDRPSGRAEGQEAAASILSRLAASTVPEISHSPALPETGA
ncbi:hypothetical protein F1640_15065 [Novosphingobium sp. NBM11]|uniref:hypothetical protein n=1 Tax=Novosphingobium sp. NBM11 TaxID=2596914 RepID=UPI0018928115|nr:hypothetical protein [Novosphingobium sp. NBM11]MBF5091307.1 hypothetical protein [Novosphingobium sp. NBM11]